MEEYISKEKIINECRQYANHEHNVQFKPDVSKDRKHDSEVAMFMCEHFRKFVKELPSADVRPNIHGHWIEHIEHCESIGAIPSGLGAYKWCSNCDCGIDVMEWHRNNYNFCPNCGADMREPKGEKGTE